MRTRRERMDDHDALRDLYEDAFPTSAEADIVETLRLAGALRIGLLAHEGKEVLGHVAFSPVTVAGPQGRWLAVGLGPMAVAPHRQRQGIGTALVEEGLRQLAGLGEEVVFVLGHPTYYPRFGFVPAHLHGIRWDHPCPPEAFMLRELGPGALAGRTGVVKFLSAFEQAAREPQ